MRNTFSRCVILTYTFCHLHRLIRYNLVFIVIYMHFKLTHPQSNFSFTNKVTCYFSVFVISVKVSIICPSTVSLYIKYLLNLSDLNVRLLRLRSKLRPLFLMISKSLSNINNVLNPNFGRKRVIQSSSTVTSLTTLDLHLFVDNFGEYCDVLWKGLKCLRDVVISTKNV